MMWHLPPAFKSILWLRLSLDECYILMRWCTQTTLTINAFSNTRDGVKLAIFKMLSLELNMVSENIDEKMRII